MGNINICDSQKYYDLTLHSNVKNIIMLTLKPIYLICNDTNYFPEQEHNLNTGNDKLNQHVNQFIEQLETYVSILIENNLSFKVMVIAVDDNQIYLTMCKHNNQDITMDDCVNIRNFFTKYNQQHHNQIIFTSKQGQLSPLFDGLGDIRLGLIINDNINYIEIGDDSED